MKAYVMKDIINLNAKETNIAIVWGVITIIALSEKFCTSFFRNGNELILFFVSLALIHLISKKDVFAFLKCKIPFVMTLMTVPGRSIRLYIVLLEQDFLMTIFLDVLRHHSVLKNAESFFESIAFNSFDTTYYLKCIAYGYGLLLVVTILWLKIRKMKEKEAFPIAIGYQKTSVEIMIWHLFLCGFYTLFLLIHLVFPETD